MRHSPTSRLVLVSGLILTTLVAGCGIGPRATPQECMERAMYFESNRSSRDGMVAVGSVVMNRVRSPDFPNSVCGVVTQKNQFARGIMSRKMNLETAPYIRATARSVLRGERHPYIRNAQYFHTASYRAGYNNMNYVLTTGGNAFYEKRRPEEVTSPVPLPPLEGITGY